jgi:hypothetical protein
MTDPAAAATDEPLGPDQYLHIATHAWWMATHSSPPHRYSYLAEVISHVWVPSDQQKDWLMDRQVTGRRIWIHGSEDQAAEAGLQISDAWPTGRWRAPHGDFFAASAGQQPSRREGSWQIPTPEFLAALPRDPHQLLNDLQAASPNDRPGYTGAFAYAADALRTGLVPADLRGALYRALLMLPGAQITEPTDTGKGQDISLSTDDGHARTEILITSANGQFSGERSTVTRDTGDLKAGTVTQSTTVTITTVDSIGQMHPSA